jgi:hypothetical protein
VLKEVEGATLIHYPSYTEKIKPSLQLIGNYGAIDASKDIFIYQYN